MANLVITSTTAYMLFEFNDASLAMETTTSYIKLANVEALKSHTNRRGTYIEIKVLDEQPLALDMTGDRGLVVDSVAGVNPSDNADLLLKLAALLP